MIKQVEIFQVSRPNGDASSREVINTDDDKMRQRYRYIDIPLAQYTVSQYSLHVR